MFNQKEYIHKYRLEHKEEIKKSNKKWRQANKDKLKEYQKEWRKNNKNKLKKYFKQYRADNEKKIRKHQRKYYKKHKKKMLEYSLEYKYGITFKDYNEIFELQEGRCAICGKHQYELNEKLSVDHNHITSEFRGLLCGKCNKGLGLFDENINILQQAINYLKKD